MTDSTPAGNRLYLSEDGANYIVRSMANMLVVVSPDGTIASVNETTCAVLDYPEAELIGHSATQLFEDEEDEETSAQSVLVQCPLPLKRTLMYHLVKYGAIINVEKSLRARNGARIPVLLSGAVMRDSWEIHGFVFLALDITERKQAEAAWRECERKRAELERFAAAGLLAAQIAHEINNPLAGIINSFRLVKTAVPLDHPYMEFAAVVETELERLSQIVHQMYKLYRPSAKSMSVLRTSCAVSEIVAVLKRDWQEKDVKIEQNLYVPPCLAAIPEHLVQQVLFNLLKNAIEASPPGGRVSIAARVFSGGIEISVADEGPGIPDDLRDKVFELMFTTKTDGTTEALGLGLWISKRIIESLQGSLTLETTSGKGATFRLYLPLSKSDQETIT